MRSPDFGDTFITRTHAVDRRTVSDCLIVFRDTNWPVVYRIRVTIPGLRLAEITAIRNNLIAFQGHAINLTTNDNIIYNGYILPKPTISEQRKDQCQFTLNFEFEGVQVSP